jgi:hypothetical protein
MCNIAPHKKQTKSKQNNKESSNFNKKSGWLFSFVGFFFKG